MPTVPRRAPDTVARAPLPVSLGTVSVPELPGAGGAIAVSRELLGQGAKLLRAERLRQNDVLTQSAYAQLLGASNDLLHNPETGLLNAEGENALGIQQAFNDGLKAIAEDISGRLKSDDQRAIFGRMLIQRTNELNPRIQQHTAQELSRMEEVTNDAVLAQLRDDALRDPNTTGGHLATARGAITSFAARRGLPQAAADVEFAQWQSGVHEGVTRQFIARGQDDVAAAYYAENAGAIFGPRRVQLEQELKNASQQGQGARLALSIRGALPAPEQERDARDQLVGMFQAGEVTAGVYEATAQRLEAGYADESRMRRVEDEARAMRVLSAIQSREEPDPLDLATSTPGMRLAVGGIASAVAKAAERQSGSLEYEAIRSWYVTDRVARLNFNWRELADFMTPKELNGLLEGQEKARAGLIGEVQSDHALDNEALRTAFFAGGLAEPTDIQSATWQTEVRNRARLLYRDTLLSQLRAGVEDSVELRAKVANNATLEALRILARKHPKGRLAAVRLEAPSIVAPPGVQRLLELSAQWRAVDAALVEIPPGEVREIRQALVNKGERPTREAIVRLWDEEQQRQQREREAMNRSVRQDAFATGPLPPEVRDRVVASGVEFTQITDADGFPRWVQKVPLPVDWGIPSGISLEKVPGRERVSGEDARRRGLMLPEEAIERGLIQKGPPPQTER